MKCGSLNDGGSVEASCGDVLKFIFLSFSFPEDRTVVRKTSPNNLCSSTPAMVLIDMISIIGVIHKLR